MEALIGLYVFVMWIVLSICCGVVAEEKGRSGFGWFAAAIFVSPLFAILMLIALPEREKRAPVPRFDEPKPPKDDRPRYSWEPDEVPAESERQP